MSFVLRSGWTAECGGINEIGVTSLYPGAVADAKHANETYCLHHDWKETSECPRWTLNSDWITVYADVKFLTGVSPTAVQDFLLFEDATGSCWKLRLAASPQTGKIELLDAGGVVRASTAGGAVSVNTWYSFTIKFKHANSTEITVWQDVSTAILYHATFDASSGGTTAVCYGYNGDMVNDVRIAHIFVGTDAGAAIDTNDTQGDTLYGRCYQNTTQGGTGDSGDALDGGTTWANAGELAANDANYARYDVDPFGLTQKGGQVNCDDGARTGPLGDAALGAADEIVGVIYVCRMRSYQGSPSGRKVDGEAYYGSSGSVATSTKYLNLPAAWVKNTDKVNILDAADANCPTLSEYARHGAEIYVGTLAGQGWIGELFACAVFREVAVTSRLVCIDGLITDVA